MKITRAIKQPNFVAVGDLKYGTLITGIANHPDSIYIKVNKRCAGERIKLNWNLGHSVLFNIKSGSLRALPANYRVKVLDGELCVWEPPQASIDDYKKQNCGGD